MSSKYIKECSPPTINQRYARAILAPFAYTLKVALQEIGATNLETLLDYFRSKLVHAILRGITKYMIDGAATVLRCTVLADVLNTPIAELAMGYDIDIV